MIKKISLKEITKTSYPFASAREKLDFEENGYIEEEYFFHGTANVYEESGRHDKKILHKNNPYINRLLIRRPKDMDKFRGDIVVEILNATAGFDIDRMWVLGATELMRRGAIYVGITSRPEMLDSLCLFDEKRYKELSWSVSYEREKNKLVNNPMIALAQAKYADRETGLFWDMLTDIAELLRNNKEIIPSLKERYIYLSGWSQSAGYMATYVRYMAFADKSKKIFDGYIAAGNVHMLITPLNQNDFGKENDCTLTKFDFMPQPFIAVQTESENAHFCGYECRQEDSDTEEFKYRIYELAGATHDTKYSLLDYYANDEGMKKTGLTPKYEGVHEYPNDYPYQYPMDAIYRHLFRWVREGILPPHADRIEIDKDLNNCTDSFGNAVGGVRTPFLDVPVSVYHNSSKMKLPDNTFGINPLFGYVENFSLEQLKKEYGSLNNYKNKVINSAKELIEKGFLVIEDFDCIIDEAIEKAAKLGLK